MRVEKIGDATLYLGDCRDILPTIPQTSVDFVFTDPPYGHNNNDGDLIERWEAALGKSSPSQKASSRPILNDGPEANEIAKFAFAEFARILRPGHCVCVCCGGGGGPNPQFARWSRWLDESVGFKQMVVWDKGKMGMGWHYRRSYETVLVGQKGGARCAWFDESGTVENIIRPGEYGIKKIIPQKSDHPTPKPVELPALFIRLHSEPDQLVVDPFMGGGTTGVACARMHRKFIGVELDEAFFEMSCRRIEAEYRQPRMRFDRAPVSAEQIALPCASS
jgi:DNA modification methylase